MTLQLLVPHIDGIQYVKRLAEVTGVAIELVRHAVQQLLHFGLVDTIDIFQYVPFHPVWSEWTRLQRVVVVCVLFVFFLLFLSSFFSGAGTVA